MKNNFKIYIWIQQPKNFSYLSCEENYYYSLKLSNRRNHQKQKLDDIEVCCLFSWKCTTANELFLMTSQKYVISYQFLNHILKKNTQSEKKFSHFQVAPVLETSSHCWFYNHYFHFIKFNISFSSISSSHLYCHKAFCILKNENNLIFFYDFYFWYLEIILSVSFGFFIILIIDFFKYLINN